MDKKVIRSFADTHPFVVLDARGNYSARFTNAVAAKAHADFIRGTVADEDEVGG